MIFLKNTIDYYYNLRIKNLVKSEVDYYFFMNNQEYHLIKYDRPIEDLNPLYNLNIQMLKKNILVHQIILNKDKQALTFINGVPYVLLKLCNYKNNKLYLNDINYIQNVTYNIEFDKSLLRDNWIKLWCDKIDYYEYQINQLGKEYPILCDSLSYFIGLGENAISYLVNNIKQNNKFLVVSHKRIKIEKGSFDFYNPLNLIIDNKARDLSEYIKNCFFNNSFDFNEVKIYFDYNNFDRNEYIYLFSRLFKRCPLRNFKTKFYK